jgi:simple sugar transport system ATP-binding protein
VTAAIVADGLAKRFGHVQALSDASISVQPGEVVALLGDNGAGKTTLLHSLLGIVIPDAGDVLLAGRHARPRTIREAHAAGIQCAHQDVVLADDLPVVDNLFLGHEVLRGSPLRRLGVVDRREMARRAEAALADLAIELPSMTATVRSHSGGQRQAVAIARAVMWARTAVLLDEPTAALGPRQSEQVCALMRRIAARGLGVLVVSHDIPRVLEVADRAVVLWRGRTVLDVAADAITVPEVVTTMVGYGRAS